MATPYFNPTGAAAGPVIGFGGVGPSQDMLNINALLNPQFDTTETLTNAAEANLAAGTQGSNFGMGQAMRLLESEKVARQKLGHEELEPYLNRAFQASEGAANRAAQLQAIAAEGAQALQRLQLQEAGETSRATAAENNALQRQVIAGQQALAQLQLGQAGDLARTRETIAGNLANTKLGITGSILEKYLSHAAPNMVGPGSSNQILPVTASGIPIMPTTEAFNPVARGIRPTGVASTGAVDSILRKYGLL